MKTIFFFLLIIYFSTFLFSTVIHVPTDQPTIQTGINASVNTDTVLVQPGTYFENINYNGKLITVASLFLTTQDTTYISQTVIDGDELDSVVKIESGEDSTTVLNGFTITNGSAAEYDYGGGIYCSNSNPSLENITIIDNYASQGGGGIYISFSSPDLMNIKISGNSSYFSGGGIHCSNSSPNLQNVTICENSAGYGGGISCTNYSSASLVNVTASSNTARSSGGGIYCSHSNTNLENVTITDNFAGSSGGGIYCSYNSTQSFNPINRCNIFMNYAGSGCEVYAFSCPTIDVIVDTFTVLYSGEYFTFPIDNYTFNILNAKIEQVDQDLYVRPDGSNENSGISVDDPLLTVSYALTRILPDSTNPLTIHLSNGTYSSFETGEVFPLNCRSYVYILGEEEFSTILDGGGLGRIIRCENDNNYSVENLTIQNGQLGIYCSNSSPTFANMTVVGNTSAGVACDSNSNPFLTNMTISNNDGTGIHCSESGPILQNVVILDNNNSGGIFGESSCASLENVTITGNSTSVNGGSGIFCVWESSLSLINVTITGNSTSEIGGGIYCGDSSVNLINCIMWNDSPQEIYITNWEVPSIATITFSDIQGGEAGIVTNNNGTVNWLEGNIDEDPLFVDSLNGDYHLTIDSPCIDAGDPNFPLDPDNTICDMGAFYYRQDQGIIIEEIYPELDSLTISECDSINFYIIASDPDGNPIEYCWELNDEVVCIDSCFTFYTDEISAGEYQLTLSITDNYQPPSRNELNFEWEVVVEDVVAVDELVPKVTTIYQNYPNPFNPETTIEYSISQESIVDLTIYNIKGQKVRQLVREQLSVGHSSAIWGGKDDNNKSVSSGIYFYKLKTGKFEKTRKMILLK